MADSYGVGTGQSFWTFGAPLQTSKRIKPITKRFLRGVPRCLQQRTSLTSTLSKRASPWRERDVKFLPKPAATGRKRVSSRMVDYEIKRFGRTLSLSRVVHREFSLSWARKQPAVVLPATKVNDVERRRDLFSRILLLSFDTSRGLIVNCLSTPRARRDVYFLELSATATNDI